MNHISGATLDQRTKLAGRLLALSTEALSFVSRDKAESMARKWFANSPLPPSEEQWLAARSLALEVALITPSLWGTTAVDRLARSLTGRPPEDIAAAALLRRGQIRLGRLSAGRFEDLVTAETRPLLASPLSGAAGHGDVFGRFVVTDDGWIVATGPVAPLDPAGVAVARGFIRADGRGLNNPARCAEAVYRHIVRHVARTDEKPEPKLPFDPVHNPLDALAAHWASLDREPEPEDIAKAREFAVKGRVLDALVCVSIARAARQPRLTEAYRRIAAVLVETIAARASYGSAQWSLDEVGAAVDAAIARGDHPPETRTLFNELRERARMASGRAAGPSGGAGGDLDRLMQRIRALREKTVEQGCTEQEALAAAEKVAELLDRYGLSLSELDLRKQSCEGIGVDTGRKRRGPIDNCMGTIATLFDCRVWGETSADGLLRYIFFGLPGDVQAAVYLHDLIALAFATETISFQAGEFYGSTHTSQRRSATNSFQLGLARGIVDKLQLLHETRNAGTTGSGGRALVPVKQSIIDQEMERLGLTFHRVNAARRKVLPGAYSAGQEAGGRFEYRPGIAGS